MQLTPVDPRIQTLLGPMASSRCLVTGASGFIGRNLIATLLAVDADVHIVTHRCPQQDIPNGGRTLSHQCDMASLQEVAALFSAVRPEYVFHLATHRDDGKHDRDAFLSGNILAADRLIRAALEWTPRRIVVAQSSLEYGHQPHSFSEETVLTPTTLHGATKGAAALLFQQAAFEHHLPVVMLRMFSVYGYWEPRKRLIPTAMQALLQGRTLPLTKGDYRRDYVFVTDVVEAFVRAALTAGIESEIINIGSGIQTSNDDLVRCLEEISGLSLTIDRGGYMPHVTDTGFWCADNTKALRLLHWKPRYTLDDGLLQTWNWFREITPHYVR